MLVTLCKCDLIEEIFARRDKGVVKDGEAEARGQGQRVMRTLSKEG